MVFKGQKNGLVILLDGEISFDELKGDFTQKVRNAKDFFGNLETSITFKGRHLTDLEEKQLLDIIFSESKLNISYIDDGFSIKSIVENEKNINYNVEFELNPIENMTYYHKSSVRSGQVVKYPGSVLIVGDVNPGGEVIAEGNINILGSLKGLVHAGCTGCKDCFVSAFAFEPTQLRIGDIISYIPKETIKTKEKFKPSFAYVDNGKIYIAPL